MDFAYIRLGYRGYTGGGLLLDGYYSANMEAATAAGVPVGVYFYSQAVSYEEGVEEANYVLSNLRRLYAGISYRSRQRGSHAG